MTPLVTQRIIEIFRPYHAEETGCDERAFRAKIDAHVMREETIPFVILAFPGKSINENSVSGHLPDLGEKLAVDNLTKLIRDVGEVYQPGMTLDVVSDGHFFSGTGVMRPIVQLDAYLDALKQTNTEPRLRLHSIHDFYPEGDIADKIAAFERQYMPTAEDIHAAIRGDRFYAWEYPDKIAFIYHEFSQIMCPGLSTRQRQAFAKMTARHFIGCQIATGRLVRDKFADRIRLSIHRQHDPTSQKYFVNLLPQVEGKGTPWFHVIAEDGGRMKLMKRIEAEKIPLQNISFIEEMSQQFMPKHEALERVWK